MEASTAVGYCSVQHTLIIRYISSLIILKLGCSRPIVFPSWAIRTSSLRSLPLPFLSWAFHFFLLMSSSSPFLLWCHFPQVLGALSSSTVEYGWKLWPPTAVYLGTFSGSQSTTATTTTTNTTTTSAVTLRVTVTIRALATTQPNALWPPTSSPSGLIAS